MSTFADLQSELGRYSSQTQRDAAEITHMLATGDYDPSTDVTDLAETAATFQRRHEAAEAALAQIEVLAATALTELLQAWSADPNPALREIAHDYTTDGTLAY
jgi:hypothetical protein